MPCCNIGSTSFFSGGYSGCAAFVGQSVAVSSFSRTFSQGLSHPRKALPDERFNRFCLPDTPRFFAKKNYPNFTDRQAPCSLLNEDIPT